jgi:hypothetical protein
MSSSYDEFDIEKEENISMMLALHTNKKLKIGGSLFGRQKLWRERIEGRNTLVGKRL